MNCHKFMSNHAHDCELGREGIYSIPQRPNANRDDNLKMISFYFSILRIHSEIGMYVSKSLLLSRE